MGFVELLKGKFGGSSRRVRDEELSGYLINAKTNLKSAFDNIGKFLDGVRDFHPARRHEALYHEEVRGRLVSMRHGLRNALVFLDERANNNINTMNPIKSVDQLRQMLAEWTRTLSANDDKVYDVLKILQIEMWSEERGQRGFPVPKSKDILCSYLTGAVGYFNEVKSHLDNYSSMASLPEA